MLSTAFSNKSLHDKVVCLFVQQLAMTWGCEKQSSLVPLDQRAGGGAASRARADLGSRDYAERLGKVFCQ